MIELTQGLWLVGEYSGSNVRTVNPKEGGKVFDPFKVESITVEVHDETRYIEWKEGKRPALDGLTEGDLVAVPVRIGRVFNGQAQIEGRGAAIQVIE